MIAFRLSSTSGLSPYLQVAHQVRQALRLGTLKPGDQLPTVKDVVGTLAINPNTVLKAYRLLEHQGLVQGRPGQGTFVIRSLESPHASSQAAFYRTLQRLVRDALNAGVDVESLTAMFDASLHAAQEETVA